MIDSYTQDPRLAPYLPAELLEGLPPIMEAQPPIMDSEYYGASRIIAREIGIPSSLPTTASWSHGWIFDNIRSFKQITGEFINPNRLYLVRNEAEREILQLQGLRAEAIGLPFLYALKAEPPPQRIPGSLLVMPTHGTTQCPVNEKNAFLLAKLAPIRVQFSTVCACVSGMCVINRQWIDQLERNDIPWITGAWVFDMNALRRMARLLQSFEYVYTDSFGSHLLYASAAGCRVVCDLDVGAMPTMEQLAALDPMYRAHPDILDDFRKEHADYESWLRWLHDQYPQFFQRFEEASLRTEWGLNELGEPCMRRPAEIAQLFDWSPENILACKFNRRPVSHVNISLDPFSEDYITDLVLQADRLQANCEQKLAEARRLFQQKNYAESLAVLAWVKQQHLAIPGTDQLRSLIYAAMADGKAARDALREEVALHPHNLEALRNLPPPTSVALSPFHGRDEVIRLCSFQSEQTRDELACLYDIASTAFCSRILGAVVECGVGEGGSAVLLAWVVQRCAKVQTEVLCFDTYEGYPAASSSEDGLAKSLPEANAHGEGMSCFPVTSVDCLAVRMGCQAFIRAVPGMMQSTLPMWSPFLPSISLIHLDTGLYSSTRLALKHLAPAVPTGGVIYVSDYQRCRGSRLATDQFLSTVEPFCIQTTLTRTGGLLITDAD
jgi:hypothetical protein